MLKLETFASNQQFINAWSYFASVSPKGEVLEANELVVTWSGTENFFIKALELDRFWQQTVFGTLGFVGNKPVSTTTTFLINDEFYLGWVATLPDYRNQGYAQAVIRHSLEQAAQRYGKKRTALHATPAGFPLYQRMGYQPTAYFRTYTC